VRTVTLTHLKAKVRKKLKLQSRPPRPLKRPSRRRRSRRRQRRKLRLQRKRPKRKLPRRNPMRRAPTLAMRVQVRVKRKLRLVKTANNPQTLDQTVRKKNKPQRNDE